MLRWIRMLLGLQATPSRGRTRFVGQRATNAPVSISVDAPAAALPSTSNSQVAGEQQERVVKRKNANIDRHAHDRHPLDRREAEILARVEERITAGHFELPHLPSTSMTLIDMSSRPSVEIAELVGTIATDPVLSSELLNTANSVLYTGQVPAETLHQAVLRIGLRSLRSMIFSVSMRGAILREKSLAIYAEEVWRQAYSVASIARKIAPFVSIDPEKAFVLGLLHDIGKVSLLAMLRKEIRKESDLSPALVGRAFYLHHERAGAALAKEWNLPEELASIAGQHHRYDENVDHPRSAAVCKLAHKIDLFASLDEDSNYRSLVHAPEMNFLAIGEADRHRLLDAARKSYVADTSVVTAS